MGRTQRTASGHYHSQIKLRKRFRNGLSASDSRVFADLFAKAGKHLAEIGYAVHPIPGVPIVWAILLEIKKELEEIEGGWVLVKVSK